MENKNITISIFGCCVQRDIFGFHQNDGGFQIDKFVSFSSPYSVMSPAIDTGDLDESMLVNTPQSFPRKSVITDMKKTAFEQLASVKSDWLLVDIADIRAKLFRLNTADGYRYFTSLNASKANLSIIKEHLGSDIELIDPMDMPMEELADSIVGLIKKLKEIYPPERMIINKIYEADSYVKNGESIKEYDENCRVDFNNRLFAKCYEAIEDEIADCHVIEMPQAVLGTDQHRWDTYPLHYSNDYYRYAMKAIEIITSGMKDEKRRLEKLLRGYSGFYELRRDSLMGSSDGIEYESMLTRVQRHLKAEEVNAAKFKLYADYFKKLLTDETAQHALKKFLKKHKGKSIAFYGDTYIARVIRDLAKKHGINVLYAVENVTTGEFETVYRRNMDEYPNVDLMVLCDVYSLDDVIKETADRYPFEILTAYDLIEEKTSK